MVIAWRIVIEKITDASKGNWNNSGWRHEGHRSGQWQPVRTQRDRQKPGMSRELC